MCMLKILIITSPMALTILTWILPIYVNDCLWLAYVTKKYSYMRVWAWP